MFCAACLTGSRSHPLCCSVCDVSPGRFPDVPSDTGGERVQPRVLTWCLSGSCAQGVLGFLDLWLHFFVRLLHCDVCPLRPCSFLGAPVRDMSGVLKLPHGGLKLSLAFSGVFRAVPQAHESRLLQCLTCRRPHPECLRPRRCCVSPTARAGAFTHAPCRAVGWL